MTEHVAEALHDRIGPSAFRDVAEWLRQIEKDHALEVDGQTLSASVAWLAETCTRFEHDELVKPASPDEIWLIWGVSFGTLRVEECGSKHEAISYSQHVSEESIFRVCAIEGPIGALDCTVYTKAAVEKLWAERDRAERDRAERASWQKPIVGKLEVIAPDWVSSSCGPPTEPWAVLASYDDENKLTEDLERYDRTAGAYRIRRT